MAQTLKKAHEPEELARLFVEFANNRDANALASLYEEDAAVAFPPGQTTVGRDAIRALYSQMLEDPPPFEVEEPAPTLYFEDLALTSTKPKDGTGGRAQVARKQPDGTWLRILDRPEAG